MIEQVIFEIDNFVMQLFNKLAGMVSQRVAYIHQPTAGIDRSCALFEVIHHVIERQYPALTR
ncbi:hypothetical protein D3C75_619450 [compost metagenome]